MSGSGCWRVKDNLSTSPIGKYKLSATLLLLVNICLLHSCLFLQSLKTNEALLLLQFNMKASPWNQKNHKNVMFLATAPLHVMTDFFSQEWVYRTEAAIKVIFSRFYNLVPSLPLSLSLHSTQSTKKAYNSESTRGVPGERPARHHLWGNSSHSRGAQPAHPFVQDPAMPPLTPPNTLAQLEEACRRLAEVSKPQKQR